MRWKLNAELFLCSSRKFLFSPIFFLVAYLSLLFSPEDVLESEMCKKRSRTIFAMLMIHLPLMLSFDSFVLPNHQLITSGACLHHVIQYTMI